ncbi:MAG TPA: hypothetical protein VEK08_20255 [Planctomycetota bacterium]|nr:hypothetical protein [Planctomycetota bacterium]
MRTPLLAMTFVVTFCFRALCAEATGVSVSYTLPADGPLPATYLVTLAVTDPKNPDWIVSQFVSGAARTVTAENKGKFTEIWNGLDDNHMPVPPGEYGLKGIFSPAKKWAVDNEWHAVTPQFVTGASSFMPPRELASKPEPFHGDPCGAPLMDVAVGRNGIAVFYYQYLENGLNNPMFDLNKPGASYEQFVRAFNSGGAGGGPCVTTDGETVWAFSTDGGPKFVYRADGKSFGVSHGANRANSYLPKGWVTAMACWREAEAPFVYVAQRGAIVKEDGRRHDKFYESKTELVNTITVHDGANGKVLAEVPVKNPQALAVLKNTLFALAQDGENFQVLSTEIKAGIPAAEWKNEFNVPPSIRPADLEIDSRGRFYLSDSQANKVYQLSRDGKITLTYGKLSAQKPGAYDRETFIAPAKLATWTDKDGNDRLIVVEKSGPNRVSEWSADGKLLREFLSLQTKCNDGYGIDPENAQHVYIPGHDGWLTRFVVDYTKAEWRVDAVWPNVGNDPHVPEFRKPAAIRVNNRLYLASGRDAAVYRIDGDRCVFSAAVLQRENKELAFWNDANGNGAVDEAEIRPAPPGPAVVFSYHGQNFGDDLSYLVVEQGGKSVWRLGPAEFDAHGNPVFREWQKLFTDPIFEARAAGKADAIHGGNELANAFTSDWCHADGLPQEGYVVGARGGKNFSANDGSQFKLSFYAPDGKGGYRLKWRTGRAALQNLAAPGEIYGGMRLQKPINGLISLIDQTRCGILLYTTDGLYVDTVFPDGRKFNPQAIGMYSLPGEFFAGSIFENKATGKVCFALGKYTPILFEAQGWSLTENPVRAIKTLPPSVSISASEISSAPEMALVLRGGAGVAKVARFTPAVGGAKATTSLEGWESCSAVRFQSDEKQSVEVRCKYDPDHLYLRWHARLAGKFQAKPAAAMERLFTHDRLADTLSFYIQGNEKAPTAKSTNGRPGDVRFVFSLVARDGAVKPVCVGMYPEWKGAGPAQPQVFRTPVGEATFAHVGVLSEVQLEHAIDKDEKGFVISAVIPRSAIPHLQRKFGGDLRTMINFEATFGGHNKFWWANSDGSASHETYDEPSEARLYPGSWAPVQFEGIDGGLIVRNWTICGPFGGPGAEKFKDDPNGIFPGTNKNFKDVVADFCKSAIYPPDKGPIDFNARYSGEMIQGYWKPMDGIKWRGASVAELDSRVILGSSSQVWYGATWIYVPEDLSLEVDFHGHPMTTLSWTLNGQPLKVGKMKEAGSLHRMSARESVAFKKGWNQIVFRGFCVGYPPFRAGVTLAGPAESLWKVNLSGAPKTE